jgi:hypothetical protein
VSGHHQLLRASVAFEFPNRKNALRRISLVEGLCVAVIAIQLAILAVAAVQQSIPIERLFRDTIAVAEEYPGCCHVYDGMISNIGILIWWATAVLCGFATIVLFTLSQCRKLVLPLAAASMLSAVLALDDLFMLHESVLPYAGLPQYLTFLIYGALVTIYVALGWRAIFAEAPGLLLLAVAMLAASASVDVLADNRLGFISTWLHDNPRTELLLDDGFKFLGLGFWFCLHFMAATKALSSKLQPISAARLGAGDRA